MAKIQPTGVPEIREAPTFTADEMEAIERHIKDAEKLLADYGNRAKYKIEVFLGNDRSFHKLMFGIVCIWASGSKHHHGGDRKLYWCPGRRIGTSNCEAIIPLEAHDAHFTVCPSCGQSWHGTQLIGELNYRLPFQHWPAVLVDHYAKCGHDADILLRYSPDELRKVTSTVMERPSLDAKLDNLRERRVRNGSIYPLERIIRDVSAGAGLYDRFRAFLSA